MTRPADPSETVEALSRRGVVRGAAVGSLAVPFLVACGDDEAAPAGGNGEEPAGEETTDGGTAPDQVTVAKADVPVGGGTILSDDSVVVTQPAEGEFKAFTAVCTHQGCIVSSVADGAISCGCHGSAFSVEDGSVVNGPATAPLAEKSVSAEGDDLVVG